MCGAAVGGHATSPRCLRALRAGSWCSQYSIAGDDSVTEGVTDLVRGTLCPALKSIFEHGLKKPSLLGGACHPWLFIEEVRRLPSLRGAGVKGLQGGVC